ncbi:MAG: patatin-like phospholipase RssA [Gammaproteobacteria bacterium]
MRQSRAGMSDTRLPRIGVALGGGSARGWAHIGVLQWLAERGVEPTVVCGTSIGALVGAAQAVGQLRRLHDWVEGLQWQDVVSYLDVSFDGGLIRGRKLFDFFQARFAAASIEELACAYGAVATDLETGQEIWLRTGDLLDAVRASAALPGLFTPIRHDGRWLVDGGLVNPVPVSLCRALGADVVIAVDLNADRLGPRIRGQDDSEETELSAGSSEQPSEGLGALVVSAVRDQTRRWKDWWGSTTEKQEGPSLLDVVTRSVHIMQVRISRSRMAGDPPDVLLTPRLSQIGLMEFHRGHEAVAAGRECAVNAAPAIENALAVDG